MGGELKECGCYDGPFSEEDETLVSLRCHKHRDDGARLGHALGIREKTGARIVWGMPRRPSLVRGPRMDVPRSRSPRRR